MRHVRRVRRRGRGRWAGVGLEAAVQLVRGRRRHRSDGRGCPLLRRGRSALSGGLQTEKVQHIGRDRPVAGFGAHQAAKGAVGREGQEDVECPQHKYLLYVQRVDASAAPCKARRVGALCRLCAFTVRAGIARKTGSGHGRSLRQRLLQRRDAGGVPPPRRRLRPGAAAGAATARCTGRARRGSLCPHGGWDLFGLARLDLDQCWKQRSGVRTTHRARQPDQTERLPRLSSHRRSAWRR